MTDYDDERCQFPIPHVGGPLLCLLTRAQHYVVPSSSFPHDFLPPWVPDPVDDRKALYAKGV